MKKLLILLLVTVGLLACGKSKEDGATLAKEVCDCKAKIPRDARGVSMDRSASITCSSLKVKATKKLRDNAAELKKFQDKVGECKDWEFKKK